MQFNLLAILAALALAPAALAKECNCPASADNGADALASQSKSDGTLTCFYYYGSGPITTPPGIHGGPGPVLPSCDYDAHTGALTGSGVFSNGECPSSAAC